MVGSGANQKFSIILIITTTATTTIIIITIITSLNECSAHVNTQHTCARQLQRNQAIPNPALITALNYMEDKDIDIDDAQYFSTILSILLLSSCLGIFHMEESVA